MALTIIDWANMFVAFAGLIFVIKIFLIWDHIDMPILKAKVFLDEKFLYNNWIYFFWIGTFTVLCQAIVIVYNSTTSPLNTELRAIPDIFEFASILLIVIFCYRWYKLLDTCKLKNQ